MRKNKGTRLLAIILMATLFVGIIPMTPAGERVYASEWWPGFDFSTDDHYNDNYDGDHDDEEKDSNVRINPLYKEVIDTEDIDNYERGIVFDYFVFIPGFMPAATMAVSDDDTTYVDTISEAGDKLRSGMVKRNETPIVYYKMDLTFDKDKIISAVDDIFSSAVRHTGKPKEGDYLNFVWKSWGSNISAMTDGVDLYLQIKYNVKYYTTASQEATLDSKIQSLKNTLNVDNKSDYAKIKAIYDYVCKNVSYDYENLYDDEYYLKYTAYAGLVNKTCVCQGYATLMYRLALEYGIDSRVIVGNADGKDHAWNIVELDGKYYYLDATWDAERSSHAYFLKGANNWTSHTAASRFQTGSFKSKYPVSSSNYVPASLGAPKIEVSNVASSGKPEITWGAVNGATKYYVYRATSENGSFSYIGTAYDTDYINTGAEAGNKYYYKVKAADDVDNVSSYSESKYITCDLAQPTGVGATTVESSGKPKITWNSVSGADRYYVYRATSSGGTYSYLGSTTNTHYTNTGAEVGTCYYYKVKAVYSSNENANSAQSSYTYVTCDLPQPTSVKVNNVESSGKPKITWTAVDGADKYYVYRATSSTGTYDYLGSTTNTHYTNTGAVVGTCYYYKVKAVYSSNENANSAQSSYGYVTCDLPQPTNVKVNNVESSGKPKITWTAVDGADKYYVYRATSSTGTYDYLGSTTNTHYTNTGAVVGTCYYYKVKAVCSSNENANSAQSSYCYITCDLPQPTNVKVNNVATSGKPKITWSAVDGADKYYVYRATSSAGTYDYLGSTVNTNYTNTGAVAGNTYYYKVKAVYTSNENANSAQSNSCYVTCDLAQPIVSVELASSGKPKVSWAAVDGASEYQIYRKVGESGTYSKYYTTTSTSMINTSAEVGVRYYYKVVAVCPATTYGDSVYSNEVSIVSN